MLVQICIPNHFSFFAVLGYRFDNTYIFPWYDLIIPIITQKKLEAY